jgi:hypothetical protein
MCWSEQMFRNMGLDPDASGDLYHRLLAAIHPTDQKSVAAAFKEFRSRPGPMRVEARLDWSGDEPHWVVLLGQTVPGLDGVPMRMHGITIDSTRRRKNEEASAAALSESGRQLSALTQDCRSSPNAGIASSAPAEPRSRQFLTIRRID